MRREDEIKQTRMQKTEGTLMLGIGTHIEQMSLVSTKSDGADLMSCTLSIDEMIGKQIQAAKGSSQEDLI